MGITDVAAGAVVGAGVGYGAAAVHGKNLQNVKFVDLLNDAGKGIMEKNSGSLSNLMATIEKYKITPQTLEVAGNRASLKVAEELGINMGAVIKRMNELKATNFAEQTGHEIGGKLKESLGMYTELMKAVFSKNPSVKDYVRFTERFQSVFTDTIAETLGASGEEKTKISGELLGAFKKDLNPKPMYEALASSGRKLIGAVKYEKAAWYEKPLVAFEAMSTKGKIGLGAVTAAAALGAAYVVNHMRGKDETPSR